MAVVSWSYFPLFSFSFFAFVLQPLPLTHAMYLLKKNTNREAKDVTKEEYNEFYLAQYKEHNYPLGVHHFKGDAGSISFKALLFIPPSL